MLIDLLRALRRTSAQHELLAAELEPLAWIDREQALKLAAAALEHACDGDWSRLHELCAGSVERMIELGYRAVLRSREPTQTFAALSVLWRASFNFGRAIAHTDRRGATMHVIDCVTIDELDGHINAGWVLGVARLIGVEDVRVQLLGRPWAGDGDEQVVRLHWREPIRQPTPSLTLTMPKLRAVG